MAEVEASGNHNHTAPPSNDTEDAEKWRLEEAERLIRDARGDGTAERTEPRDIPLTDEEWESLLKDLSELGDILQRVPSNHVAFIRREKGGGKKAEAVYAGSKADALDRYVRVSNLVHQAHAAAKAGGK
jgi:hypothetical protein